ncbi:MAG: mannose-6-phosphate isomerase, class I [Nocardioidaceae bacterium]|nr:mannose-6-phosphate isomerase, class I [Nocardioidaceae bacterium]
MLRRLDNPVRKYAWGSRTHIARMCGLDFGGDKVAEMWLGAHPGAPSVLDDARPLHEAIAADAATFLGPVVSGRGDRLPFLMKLLAAAEPLSLQVHPTTERARRRFAEQDAAGIDITAPERSYQDESHKPEMIYALTRFEGMAGFRDVTKTAAILRGLGVAWLDELATRLEQTDDAAGTLHETVTWILAMHGPDLAGRMQEVQVAAAMAESTSHRPTPRLRPATVAADEVQRESIRVYAALGPLIDQYPDDPGVLVTLLLNHVVLAPGEAMFIDAGVVHAYTSGFGVEIMASSDNVLRAGLTPKHVDVEELLEITAFTPVPPPTLAPAVDEDGTRVFRPPVDEFELAVHEVGPHPLTLPQAPQIAVCLVGSVDLVTADGKAQLHRGDAVFVDGTEVGVEVRGTGRLAIGRTPA